MSAVDGAGYGGAGVGVGDVAKKIYSCGEFADGGLGLGLHARVVIFKSFMSALGGSLKAKLLFVWIAFWCDREPEIAKNGFKGLGGGDPGGEFIGSIWGIGRVKRERDRAVCAYVVVVILCTVDGAYDGVWSVCYGSSRSVECAVRFIVSKVEAVCP